MKPGDRSILLVDDSQQDLLLIKAALKSSGVANPVQTATSADGAIRCLTSGSPPAIVFLDLQMPVKDGLQLLGWIRARPEAWHRVPIVVLTTSHDSFEIRRAYDLGANSFLVKATGYEELRETLSDACDYWLKRNRDGDLES
jgi:CheY-like chemotaxis protein